MHNFSLLLLLLSGTKHTVKVTPMTPLHKIVEEALAMDKKSGWDVRKCKLTCNKKPVDLDLMWRFANLPAGSKIDVEYTGPR